MQQIIHDSKGQWLVNKANFGFVDPMSGARFDPHVPTKAQKTEWVKSQPFMSDWVDMNEEVPVKAPVKEPVKEPEKDSKQAK